MDIIEHVTTYKLDTLHYYGAKFWAGAKPRARDPRLYALTTIASSTIGISIGGGGGGGGGRSSGIGRVGIVVVLGNGSMGTGMGMGTASASEGRTVGGTAMVEARATTALKAATVASAAFAAGPRRRRRHSRCQRGDTAHCREALARGMNILHIPRRATGGGNEPREERGRSASCLNGCVERRRRGRGGASGPRRLALSGKRACTVVDVSARLVMPDAPVRREVGVRSRCEACRGDGGEPVGSLTRSIYVCGRSANHGVFRS